MTDWKPAVDEFQLPFMAAASRALRSEPGLCARCGGSLRCYFHRFQPAKGTVWVWCGDCRTHAHLPRVESTRRWVDPFATLSLEEFAKLEIGRDEQFLDRLERMWRSAELGVE